MSTSSSIKYREKRSIVTFAAVDINGELTLILVFNAGDDEEYLRKTLKIPDDDTLRQAVHHFMEAGVWPTHR